MALEPSMYRMGDALKEKGSGITIIDYGNPWFIPLEHT